MNYWENYYKENTPDQIPWDGNGEIFFNNIWQKHKLPHEGNLLNIGCGRGNKSIFLSQNFNLKVWGFDISETAIKAAHEKAKEFKDKVKFFVCNAQNIGQAKELEGIQFSVITDIVTSQFLTEKEKLQYLEGLQKHLVQNKTFYILNTFVKDNEEDKMEGYVEWVKEIAQSPRMIEKTYLKYFKVVDSWIKESPKGKVGTYIMISK